MAWIIFYEMKKLKAKTRTKVLDKLFGKVQKSNFAQYKYQIDGIVSEKEYIKPIRSVIIIKKRYVKSILALFDNYNIGHRVFEIKLGKNEFKKIDFFAS